MRPRPLWNAPSTVECASEPRVDGLIVGSSELHEDAVRLGDDGALGDYQVLTQNSLVAEELLVAERAFVARCAVRLSHIHVDHPAHAPCDPKHGCVRMALTHHNGLGGQRTRPQEAQNVKDGAAVKLEKERALGDQVAVKADRELQVQVLWKVVEVF